MIVIIFSNDLFMIWANCAWSAILQLRNEILNLLLASAFSHKFKDEKQNQKAKQNRVHFVKLLRGFYRGWIQNLPL